MAPKENVAPHRSYKISTENTEPSTTSSGVDPYNAYLGDSICLALKNIGNSVSSVNVLWKKWFRTPKKALM